MQGFLPLDAPEEAAPAGACDSPPDAPALPPDAPAIHFFRAGAWPASAPAPDLLLPAARLLATALAPSRLPARLPLRALIVHANRRVSVSLRPRGSSALEARLHWLLLRHETLTRDALGAALRTGRFPHDLPAALTELARSAAPLDGPSAPRRSVLTPAGRHHDLRALAADLRPLLPELGDMHPELGWARLRRARKGTRIRLGSAWPESLRITLHPILDAPIVPDFVVAHVLHHELCHLAAPPLTRAEARRLGEHRVHHRHFRALEARYPQTDAARIWLDDHLHQLRRDALRIASR